MNIPVGGEPRVVLEKYGKGIFWQTFTMPDGSSSEFLIHGVQKMVQPSIFMPVTTDRQVIAVRQFRYGANETMLELPGGCPKPGQTPEEVLTVELVEETGYKPGKIIQLNRRFWFEPANLRCSYFPFLALDCEYVKEPQHDPTEVIEVVKMPLDEWVRLAQSGEIEDDKSVAITFLALRHLK